MSIYTEKRIDYGQWCIAQAWTTPSATSSFMGGGKQERFANNLWKTYSNHYNDCFVDIVEINTSHTQVNAWYRQRFTSEANTMAFCTANCATSGGYFTNNVFARYYDIVDFNIPRITKMYGINQFYSVLKGSKRYWPVYTERYLWPQAGSHRWTNCQSFVTQVINQTVPPAAPWTYNAGDQAERAIWFSQSKSGLYGLPHPNTTLDLDGTNARGRYSFSTGSSSFSPASANGGYQYEMTRFKYYAMQQSTGSFWQLDQNPASINPYLGAPYVSIIAVYSLVYIHGIWDYAAVIKPIGIDNVIVNYFSIADYELFGHYEHKWHHPDIKQISPIVHDGAGTSNSIWVLKNSWMWWKMQSFASSRMTSEEFPSIRFFLRDKKTKLISPYSTSKIVMAQNHRDGSFKLEIKHNA